MGRDNSPIVTMWSVLTVVFILTCHFTLGQDGMSLDTVDSLRQGEASEDTRLPKLKYSCPEDNVGFLGRDIAYVTGIQDWHACGEICSMTTDCNFWSWIAPPSIVSNLCCLKSSDDGLTNEDGVVSGVKGCH